MRIRLSNKTSRLLIAGIMLFAFAVRALVPQGFMPASHGPLTLEICPEGFPAQLLAHTGHHHGGGHSYSDHCVFGTACAGGPPSHVAPLGGVSLPELAPAAPRIAGTREVRLVYLPQARGPPAT
jgi:hypothetical protein